MLLTSLFSGKAYAFDEEFYKDCANPLIRYAFFDTILNMKFIKNEDGLPVEKPDCAQMISHIQNKETWLSFTRSLVHPEGADDPMAKIPVFSVRKSDFALIPDFVWLDIKEVDLPTLTEGFFNGMPKLTRMTLSNINISKIEIGAFDGLPELESLSLSGLQVESLKPGIFRGLTNLKELTISCRKYDPCKIKSIVPGVFEDLPNLIKLRLEAIQVTELPPETFKGLNKLENLDLSELAITKLPPLFFSEMENLEKVSFTYNQGCTFEFQGAECRQGVYIRKDSFFGAPNLRSLNLTASFFSVDQASDYKVRPAPNRSNLSSNLSDRIDILKPLNLTNLEVSSAIIKTTTPIKVVENNKVVKKTVYYSFEHFCGVNVRGSAARGTNQLKHDDKQDARAATLADGEKNAVKSALCVPKDL